jgi:hypothetical protein
MIPKSVPKKLQSVIDHWDDERNIGNGIIITIKGGYKWSFDDHGLHVRGYDTVREATDELRDVVPCNCEQCK